jgi:hypothetical protein
MPTPRAPRPHGWFVFYAAGLQSHWMDEVDARRFAKAVRGALVPCFVGEPLPL